MNINIELPDPPAPPLGYQWVPLKDQHLQLKNKQKCLSFDVDADAWVKPASSYHAIACTIVQEKIAIEIDAHLCLGENLDRPICLHSEGNRSTGFRSVTIDNKTLKIMDIGGWDVWALIAAGTRFSHSLTTKYEDATPFDSLID
ncbi:hypothetical protein OAG71_01115 [bacterium]|nr:hypothetical protein [bacterium]